MKRKSIILTAVLVLLQLCSSLWALPTTAYEAGMAVVGWLKGNPQPLDTALAPEVMRIETFTNNYGEPVSGNRWGIDFVAANSSSRPNGSVEDFETNNFSEFPWEHEGDSHWTTTTWEKHSGNYSAQAGTIEDYGSTTLRVRLDCISGNITFYRKVSSESISDCLTFYIDGVEKDTWSGDEDWAEASFPVAAGTRTFEWTYSKDYSVAEGDDTAWIDDIAFPVDCSNWPPPP